MAPSPLDNDVQRKERIGDTPSTFRDEETRGFLREVDGALGAVLATTPARSTWSPRPPRSRCWTRSARR